MRPEVYVGESKRSDVRITITQIPTNEHLKLSVTSVYDESEMDGFDLNELR